MSEQAEQGEDSALLQEVMAEFLETLSKDSAVPPHILAALAKHFKVKPTISANELKAILAASAGVP